MDYELKWVREQSGSGEVQKSHEDKEIANKSGRWLYRHLFFVLRKLGNEADHHPHTDGSRR